MFKNIHVITLSLLALNMLCAADAPTIQNIDSLQGTCLSQECEQLAKNANEQAVLYTKNDKERDQLIKVSWKINKQALNALAAVAQSVAEETEQSQAPDVVKQSARRMMKNFENQVRLDRHLEEADTRQALSWINQQLVLAKAFSSTSNETTTQEVAPQEKSIFTSLIKDQLLASTAESCYKDVLKNDEEHVLRAVIANNCSSEVRQNRVALSNKLVEEVQPTPDTKLTQEQSAALACSAAQAAEICLDLRFDSLGSSNSCPSAINAHIALLKLVNASCAVIAEKTSPEVVATEAVTEQA